MPSHSTDAILGCLIGGAIGDAMGSSAEGSTSGSSRAERISERWSLTDDTQLTLATCEAIIAANRVEPAEIAASMLQWHRRSLVHGAGSSTLKALRDLDAGIHWALAGRQGERAAGNGAAMRIAPLAFLLDPTSLDDRRTIRDVCRITHHSDEAYAGALAVLLTIHGKSCSQLPDTNVRDRILAYEVLGDGAKIADAAAKFGVSGYVAESIPLALFAANQCQSIGFESMLGELIAVGGDTDTNASIAGQLAGVRIGLSALPKSLIERMPEREMVLRIARAFAEAYESV